MSIIGDIIGFFKTPKKQTSAYGATYASIVSALKRDGVKIGSTASYPRVEIYGINEGSRMDKEGSIRQITFNCESVSNSSLDEAKTMNDENMARLTGSGLVTPDGWRCMGVVPDTLQDATETSDTNKIIYRLIQGYSLWMERI